MNPNWTECEDSLKTREPMRGVGIRRGLPTTPAESDAAMPTVEVRQSPQKTAKTQWVLREKLWSIFDPFWLKNGSNSGSFAACKGFGLGIKRVQSSQEVMQLRLTESGDLTQC